MTEDNKELLLHFVTRMSMYIHPVETNTAISFIHGYEAGAKDNCDFTEQVRQLLTDKYKIDYSSDGWPGQLKRLAKRRHSTWLIVFRKITLEVLMNTEGGNLVAKQQAFLRRAIASRIERVEPTPPPWLGDDWVDDWRSLCAMQSAWFKQLWTCQEWLIIRAIDRLVQANGFFQDENQRLPSPALLQLKDAYVKATSEGEALKKA